MENVLKYYEFSEFFQDISGTFSHPIAYTELNPQHFLIFENENEAYHLSVARYPSESQIGKSKPEILEFLIENYDTSNSEHRVLLRHYLE